MKELLRESIAEHKAVLTSIRMIKAAKGKVEGIDFINQKAKDRLGEVIKHFEEQEKEMRKHIEKEITNDFVG